VEIIRGKQGKQGKNLSDAAKIKNYVAYHRKCARQENGRRVFGAYVENEMICAVAHQNNIIIAVASALQPEFQVITANGSFLRFDDEQAEQTPFFLWCTGGHYQAIVKLQDVEVRSSALSAPGFLLGNFLQSVDIRKPQ
jgi:hypothetical protein